MNTNDLADTLGYTDVEEGFAPVEELLGTVFGFGMGLGTRIAYGEYVTVQDYLPEDSPLRREIEALEREYECYLKQLAELQDLIGSAHEALAQQPDATLIEQVADELDDRGQTVFARALRRVVNAQTAHDRIEATHLVDRLVLA